MYIDRVEDKAFHMTCMAMPKHTYPCPWVYERAIEHLVGIFAYTSTVFKKTKFANFFVIQP